MSKKTARRKKASPAKRVRKAFTITVEAQEIAVSYQPHWTTDIGHFEFRSPHEPRRPIPISETGYRSHFSAMADIEAAASPRDFAREVALDILRSEKFSDGDERGQLSLF
jgi:hypothetical protein